MDPHHIIFIFDYISHHQMNSIMLSKIFLNFVWTSKLKHHILIILEIYLSLHKISLNTPRNTLNYMCDLDPLFKIWSNITPSHVPCKEPNIRVITYSQVKLHCTRCQVHAIEKAIRPGHIYKVRLTPKMSQ